MSHRFEDWIMQWNPFVSAIYALLRIKGLKQMIKLSDQNIWDDTDADNSGAPVSIIAYFRINISKHSTTSHVVSTGYMTYNDK